MSNRYGRRRFDGIFEYSDSLEDIELSAIREDEAFLRERLALIGFVVGAIMMYWLIGRHVPEWPKVSRFISIFAGAGLTSFVCASNAVLLRQLFEISFTLAILGGIGCLLWQVLW
jgi:hypothetical protein